MARSTPRKAIPQEDIELDEVDTFNANREKIFLDEAKDYAPRNTSDEKSESSDEEVLGLNDSSDNEEENQEGSNDELDSDMEETDNEEHEEKGWGGKQNYYGGDEGSDDEDARQMTEEAMRQQKKHLNDLAMYDYVDEEMMDDWKKAEIENKKSESDNQILFTTSEDSISKLDDNDRLKLLNSSFPEFVPLLQELIQLKSKLQEFQAMEYNKLVQVKRVALSAYLSAVSSYFALFTEKIKNGDTFLTMKDNPVMETILSSREVWRQASELPFEEPEEITEASSDSGNEEIFMSKSPAEESEQGEYIANYSSDNGFDDVKDESDSDLNIDIGSKRHIKKSSGTKFKYNDYSESAAPSEVDLEDKQRRKRTLRFYTSKIDQSVAKSDRERFSGDLDLPYKERLFERQQRLTEEARKRGLGGNNDQLGDDLDGKDMDSGDEIIAHNVNDDGYYDQVKKQKQYKKDARRNAHETAVRAAREGKLLEAQEELGSDGKRALNFQILKNKGLTPHRNKDNRNSRVKKRKKYEKAQKKLKSVRQVYDGNNRGPYQGEKTGIKKGISRSVKLA